MPTRRHAHHKVEFKADAIADVPLRAALASALKPTSSNATPCPEFDLNALSYCVVSTRFAQEVALLPAAAE